MKQIYLARHAETVEPEYRSVGQLLIDFQTRSNFGNEPLSEKGKEEARILAQAIKETFKPDGHYYLFTPPNVHRMTETALILCQELGIYAGQGDSMWFTLQELNPRLGITGVELDAIVERYENHPYKQYEDQVSFNGAIMVTSHSVIPSLATFIARKHNFAEIPYLGIVKTGHAVYLDLENRTSTILPNDIT